MNKKPSRPQVNPNTLKRLLGYLSVYKTRVILVVICILLSAIANVMSSLFIQRLIDDYISPLLLEANPVFDALFRAIVQMACIYVIGILASLIYNSRHFSGYFKENPRRYVCTYADTANQVF